MAANEDSESKHDMQALQVMRLQQEGPLQQHRQWKCQLQ